MAHRRRRLVAAASSLCLVALGCGQAPTGSDGTGSTPGPILTSQGAHTVSFDALDGLVAGESVEGLGTVHEFLDIRSTADPSGDTDGDATRADPATLRLDGMEVATRGDGRRPLVSEEDVDGDGRPDLVAKFDDEAGTWSGDEVEARLTGETVDDGTPFRGSDRVCLVP